MRFVCLLALPVTLSGLIALPMAGADVLPDSAAPNGAPLAQSQSGDIVVRISGVLPGQGQVIALLYQSESGFPGKENLAMRRISAAASTAEVTLRLPLVPYGSYAVTVYQDLNSNQKLDTNWIGIPKEPVAVSNNAKGRMGPPKYKDAKFNLGEPIKEIGISLIKL